MKFIVIRYATDVIEVEAEGREQALEIATQATSGFDVVDTEWQVEAA